MLLLARRREWLLPRVPLELSLAPHWLTERPRSRSLRSPVSKSMLVWLGKIALCRRLGTWAARRVRSTA
jgi:hypothetical protein